METSHMNHSLHSGIIQAIREISVDRGDRGYFVNTLEQIISDFQDQITIDATRDPGASASRIGRRPETPVLDSWREWDTIRRSGYHDAVRRRRIRELCPCTYHSRSVTVDFIEKIFVHGLSNGREDTNITWGTLLRYFVFIHLEIYENVGGTDVVAEMEAVAAHSIVNKFNNEEEESMNTLTAERAKELGYLCGHPVDGAWAHAQQPGPGPIPEPTPEQKPEQTPTQRTNESVRKFQDIIDSLSRGEKVELNEGEYLQLSDYLKRSFVS